MGFLDRSRLPCVSESRLNDAVSTLMPLAIHPSTDDQLQPVPAEDRFHAIDILRGIALFGVLAVNLVNEFRVPFFSNFFPHPTRFRRSMGESKNSSRSFSR